MFAVSMFSFSPCWKTIYRSLNSVFQDKLDIWWLRFPTDKKITEQNQSNRLFLHIWIGSVFVNALLLTPFFLHLSYLISGRIECTMAGSDLLSSLLLKAGQVVFRNQETVQLVCISTSLQQQHCVLIPVEQDKHLHIICLQSK